MTQTETTQTFTELFEEGVRILDTLRGHMWSVEEGHLALDKWHAKVFHYIAHSEPGGGGVYQLAELACEIEDEKPVRWYS